MSSVRRERIEHEIFGGPLCLILLVLDNPRVKGKTAVENISEGENFHHPVMQILDRINLTENK